ncbi:proline racemase family protein, partial [Rhizobium ruizarguesonis]
AHRYRRSCFSSFHVLAHPALRGRVAIETPAGRVDVTYEEKGGYVDSVRLHNVASYIHEADVEVEVPGMGRLRVDISYGG